MTNFSRTLQLTATVLALSASFALAQQGKGGRFDDIDTNKDGRLAFSEVEANAADVFNAMDADSNNELTLEEFMTVRMGPQQGNNPERQAERQADKEARFHEMDADKNGTVTREQFLANVKLRFESADSDGDGKVTRPEWRASRW